MIEENNKIKFIAGLAIVVGATIGGGFWATPIVAGALVGPLSIFATLGVGALILVAIPAYVALARIWPVSPGHYYYPTRLLFPENKSASQLVGWVVNWAAVFVGGFTVTRYMTVSGAEFLHGLVPSVHTSGFTVLLITFSFLVIWFGIRTAGRTEVLLSAILLVAMGAIVIYGFTIVDPSNLTPIAPAGLSPVLPALALLVSLGAGPLLAIDIGGEIEDPDSSVKNVILTGGAANVGLGTLIGIVALGIVPYTQLEGITLTSIVQQQYPAILSLISGIGALLAGVTTNVGYVLMVNRYAMAAADDNILPEWLTVENQYGEPKILLVCMYALSIVAVVLDLPLGAIASGFAFILLAQVTLVLLVGVRLPSQYPAIFERDAITKSWYLKPTIVQWSSVVGAIITTILFGFLAYDQQVTFGYLLGVAALGALIYGVRWWTLEQDELLPINVEAIYESEGTNSLDD